MSADLDPQRERDGPIHERDGEASTGAEGTDTDAAAVVAGESDAAVRPSIGEGAIPAAAGLFERVLIVTDGDAPGRAAVETGLGLAARCDADADVLYVVDTAEHWDMVVERREATGEAAVEEAAERGAQLGVDVTKRFRYGRAHEEVLDYAAKSGADLIVVGSSRPTGLDRLVDPDTVAPRVQRNADVPVMVVGPDDD